MRDQIAPNPVVVTDAADRIEVGAVTQRVSIGNHDDMVMVGNRRSDGRIHAEVGGPSGNQDPIRRDLVEARLQVRAGERIVQILLRMADLSRCIPPFVD